MDKIVWQLGADSSSVRSDMTSTMRASKQFAGEVSGSFDRVDASHEKLLRSSHRVAKQVQNVARDFASGASAGDIFATSLEGIGRSLNLSLGALAGIAVGATIITKIAAVREEYHKLLLDLNKIHEEANKSGDFKTLSAIEAQAKKAEEAVKKIGEAMDSRAGKKGIGSAISQLFSDASNNLLSFLGGTGTFGAEQEKKDRAMRSSAYGDQDTLIGQEVAKRRQQSGLKQVALDGAPDSAIKAAQVLITAEEKVVANLDLMAEVAREASVALQEITKAANDKKAERAGMSLKELAGMEPDVVNNSVSYERYQASQQAKRAMALDAQGETARANFDPQGAHDFFNAAGEAKEGITDLKPSEKMSADLKGALATTEAELRQIADNTRKQFVNR